MSRPNLFELQSVVSIAAHKSFRAAAAELGTSPSALSHSVAALEKRLGVPLFHRTTRSVALTEAGDRFLSRVRPALRELSTAMESINEFRDTPRGTVRINTSEAAANRIFKPVILELLRRHPDLRVDLVTESRLIDIVKEGFDAGIRPIDAVPRDMVAIPCGPKQRYVVVGTPQYFKTHPKPKVPADLGLHTCIRMRKPSGGIYAWEFERRGEELSVEVDGRITLDTHSLILDAVLGGVGLAYMNRWPLAAHLKTGRLIAVLEDWLPPWPGMAVFYPSQRHASAGLRAFVEIVKEFTRGD
ncbi:MAG TPA: LysR family transcriptional regulator [Polyangiaceae bacterium]|jgi:DNA-binding transcriptional LysR family regulator|nr:LysR family transcriptional regulator [Polyangiaceae bacterium]